MRTLFGILTAACVLVGCDNGANPPSDIAKSKANSPEFSSLLDQCMEELQIKTAGHDAVWHIGEATWSVNQGDRKIVFSTPNGFTATCPVQIIGTFNLDDNTWLWSWDNPSADPALTQDAMKVREYGQKHGIESLTTRKIHCTEDEAWELGALACKLCKAQGAYRGPSGQTRVLMTFGEVKLGK